MPHCQHKTNHFAGLSAEQSAAAANRARGATLLETRWRGPGGEIDLILAEAETLVFVEVKKSKTHDAALQRVSARQLARVAASAVAYVDQCASGALTEMRLDVALVDAVGAVKILPNVSLDA